MLSQFNSYRDQTFWKLMFICGVVYLFEVLRFESLGIVCILGFYTTLKPKGNPRPLFMSIYAWNHNIENTKIWLWASKTEIKITEAKTRNHNKSCDSISYMIICREMGLAIQAFQHVSLLSPGGDTWHTLLLQGVYSVIHLEIHSETHPHGTMRALCLTYALFFAIMYHALHGKIVLHAITGGDTVLSTFISPYLSLPYG